MGLMELVETAGIAIVVGVIYLLRRLAVLIAEIQAMREEVRGLKTFIANEGKLNAGAVINVLEDHLAVPAERRIT